MRIIIVGGDETVYYLARLFVRRHYHVTIINRNETRSHHLAQHTKATVVLGDGTDVHRIEEAGARQADAILAMTPSDPDNLLICQIAARRFRVPRTISLVNDPDNEEIFQRLGVSVAFSATRIIGSLLERETDFDSIKALMPLARGHLNIVDIRIDADAPSAGRSLLDLPLAPDTLVACILRGDDVIVPRGSTFIQPDDHLIIITHPENEQENIAILCGQPGS
jgi:trk system potassium uptake protein